MRKAIILTLTLTYLKFNLMSALEYRTAFLLQVFGMMLNNVAMLFFWWAFFTQFPPLNGWDLRGVITLYALVAGNYGLGLILFGNGFNLARIIMTGGLDYYLALPVSPLMHTLISRMSLSAWGDFCFGVVLFAWVWGADGMAWLMFATGVVLGAVVMVSFGVMLGSLAFYLGNAESLSETGMMALVSFSTYPTDLFPPAIRLLLYTLIPAAFLSTIPAELVRGFNGWSFVGYGVGTLLIALVARWIFYRGLRRYESGNLLVARM
jgi:ABC-2 type transport system permease protein